MTAVDNSAESPGESERDASSDDPPIAPVEVEANAGGRDSTIAGLEAAIARLEKEKKDTYDKFVRAVADLDNFRKRSRRDLEDAKVDSKSRVLKEMLPVVDNLERAVEHADKQGGESSSIIEGIRLVLRQFAHAFERCDVAAIDAQGQIFDPNLHEAISQQPSTEPPGTVVSVLQKGYRVGDRLLRPAMVVVAKAEDGEGAGGAGGDSSAP